MRLHTPTTTVLAAGLLALASAAWAGPKGAKAIFDSGTGGGTIGMSVNATPTPVARNEPVAEKYAGISYQILIMGPDGQMTPVSKSRTFRSGERVKILASTSRPGYLTVANIGSSGRMQILFSEPVDARRLTQIPPSGNLRFDATPGTERLLLMLSNEPNPLAGGTGVNTAAVAAPTPLATAPTPVAVPQPVPVGGPPAMPNYPAVPATPTGADAATASLPTYPSNTTPLPTYPAATTGLPADQASASLVASLEGAKSLKVKGAKDLLVDDEMQNSYTVMMPTPQGYKAVRGGAKDLLVESSEGIHYGVVPASAMVGGGILTLEINLKHR
ncbi:MAG: hypothetical protein OHK0048_09180 [Rhodoferax sp.]